MKSMIIVLFLVMIISCNGVNPPDLIDITNNSLEISVYEEGDKILVKGLTLSIITEIEYSINAQIKYFNDSIVKDEVKVLYDMSSFIDDRFYDEVYINIINVETY